MAENEEESINIINENIDKAIEMTPVIFSLFGNALIRSLTRPNSIWFN